MPARPAVALAALGLAAASAVAIAPSASAVDTPDPSKTYLVDCQGNLTIKPKMIQLACGDGAVYFMKITWSSWDSNGATGVGTLKENLCEPNCAAGNYATYKKVKLTLGGVASGGSLNVFSSMTGSFGKYGGPAIASTLTWVMDNPAKVTR